MIFLERNQSIKTCSLVTILVLCCSSLATCRRINVTSFTEGTGWLPPVLDIEVSQLSRILTTTHLIYHSDHQRFEATLHETIRTYLLRINCIADENETIDLDLVQKTLNLMHTMNQLKHSRDRITVYLSLVPGVQNVSGYLQNLDRIKDIANATTGVISHVLLDLSSVDVGPLDGFSITQKYMWCKELGDIYEFTCGFIFDFRICPDKMSLFGHIQTAKSAPVFLRSEHGAWKNMVAAYDPSRFNLVFTCFLAIRLTGMKFAGVTHDYEKMLLNSTHFEMDSYPIRTFMGPPIQSIAPVMMQEDASGPDCYLKVPKSYSNLSSNHSSAAVTAISSEDFVGSLQKGLYVHNNSSHDGIPFLELFHRFLVRFPSVRERSVSSHGQYENASLPTVMKEVLEHSERHKKTYHLRPLELWISFTPGESIRDELKTVTQYGKQMNSVLPGTVTYIILDYNNLRLDSPSVISVVKNDIEACNSLVTESNIRCGYIFFGRNCRRGNEWLSQMPFQNDSKLLFRGQPSQILNCLRAFPSDRFGTITDRLRQDSINIDWNSQTATIPKHVIQVSEGSQYLFIPSFMSVSDYLAYVENFWKPAISKNWLHSPVKFSKSSVGFVVKLEDLSNIKLLELVTEQRNVVIQYNGFSQKSGSTEYNLTSLCRVGSLGDNHQISILIKYKPDLADNLNQLDDILLDTIHANSYCGGVINEILIDWNFCFKPAACIAKNDSYYYNHYHFAGLAGVTNYIERIKKKAIKTGLFITSQTFAVLVDATHYVTGRWMDMEDPQVKYLALRLPTLFNVSEIVSVLDRFDVFVYKTSVRLADIINENAFITAMRTQEKFESISSVLTNVQMHLFHNSSREESTRLKIMVSKHEIGEYMSSNETLDFAWFLEMLSNWAFKMGYVLIIDTAYQSAKKESCQEFGDDSKCAYGWWTIDKSPKQLMDRKSHGVWLISEETKRKTRATDSSVHNATNYLIVAPVILILLVSLSVLFAIKINRKRYTVYREVLRKLVAEFPSNVDPVLDFCNASRELIGQGSSKTSIYKCKLKTGIDIIDVAVKAFKSAPGAKLETENLMALYGLISEAKTLRNLKAHSNVVKFFGLCASKVRQGELQIVLEYCSRGSLNNMLPSLQSSTDLGSLHSNKFVETSEKTSEGPLLLKWSIEIANGFEYLISQNIVHADIATRNILLDEQMCCKICDFGLSRRMEKYQSYVKTGEEPLPWRWMAPESLRKLIFNEKTDVWMYGVTLWEIFTFGQVPYGGLSWSTEFVTLLDGGLRLELPSCMPTSVKQLVTNCWDLEVKNRPTFSECKLKLMTTD